MSDAGKLLDGIYTKAVKMINRQNSLIEQNTQLNKKQEELNNTIENQNKLIEQLKDKNRNLKFANSIKQSEGNIDVKNKIDELVREIDKCIGLLNK
ncbi:MAG: hypothetical protein K8R86_02845 [Bacteroidales bacterium]|nr:hypothetical protein [Bacteroidales bacterium]